MRSLSICLAFVASLALTASSKRLTSIPFERPYLASNAANLSHTVPELPIDTAGDLLKIIDNYGLTKYFGVSMLHQHFYCPDGKVIYETGNNAYLFAEVRNFSDIKNKATPYTNRVAQIARVPQLLPIDYGPITESAKESRLALAQAVQKGFLNEYYTALASNSIKDIAGLGLILDIHRAALAGDNIVFNEIMEDHNRTLATVSSKADVNVSTITSFYMLSDNVVKPLVNCKCDTSTGGGIDEI